MSLQLSLLGVDPRSMNISGERNSMGGPGRNSMAAPGGPSWAALEKALLDSLERNARAASGERSKPTGVALFQNRQLSKNGTIAGAPKRRAALNALFAST